MLPPLLGMTPFAAYSAPPRTASAIVPAALVDADHMRHDPRVTTSRDIRYTRDRNLQWHVRH
eukprot:4275788-Pyramimonas_sp.AAC.1